MSYNNKNRDEERVFSVTMTEEELSLFSEFLEQREYAGPVKRQNRILRNQRLDNQNPYKKEIQVRKTLGKEVSKESVNNANSYKQAQRRFERSMPSGNLGWYYGGEGSPRVDQKAMKSSIHNRINAKSVAVKSGKHLIDHNNSNTTSPGLFRFAD